MITLTHSILTTHRWLKDLFRLGMRRSLNARDIYKNLRANDAAMLADTFQVAWTAEIGKQRGAPRIWHVIWAKCVSKVIGYSFLYSALDILCR